MNEQNIHETNIQNDLRELEIYLETCADTGIEPILSEKKIRLILGELARLRWSEIELVGALADVLRFVPDDSRTNDRARTHLMKIREMLLRRGVIDEEDNLILEKV